MDDPSNPKAVHLHLKQSKTDPFRRGVKVYIGATDNQLSLVPRLLGGGEREEPGTTCMHTRLISPEVRRIQSPRMSKPKMSKSQNV